jgi:hypothetical protein
MKTFFTVTFLVISFSLLAQEKTEKKAVEIFNGDKAINAMTPETVGKGKMAFRVTHNFGDFGGSGGGVKRAFGLDNSADIRIAFQAGIGKKFDLVMARAKGAGPQQQLLELGVKYKLMEQLENDPSHPISVAFYANGVVACNKPSAFPNLENSFHTFSERSSNAFQLVIARKMGNISVQLNPVFVRRGYAISYDQKNYFALGGAIKFPLIKGRLNLLVDYFHPFRKDAVADSFKIKNNLKFYDPLGIGFEIITAGHTFRLNYTNSTDILENRFIPRTITNWGDGQFRWGFTISRTFTLWRPKK